jgi:hypothetical protein
METRDIVLVHPLKIGEVQHYPGETVTLDLETADWLVQSVIEYRQQRYDKQIVIEAPVPEKSKK